MNPPPGTTARQAAREREVRAGRKRSLTTANTDGHGCRFRLGWPSLAGVGHVVPNAPFGQRCPQADLALTPGGYSCMLWPMKYRVTLVESEEGWAVWCDDLTGCCSQGAPARRHWLTFARLLPSFSPPKRGNHPVRLVPVPCCTRKYWYSRHAPASRHWSA